MSKHKTDITEEELAEMRTKFNEMIKSMVRNNNTRSEFFTRERYNAILEEVKGALRLKEAKKTLSSMQYRRLKRFEIATINGVEKLVERNEQLAKSQLRPFCMADELFDLLHEAHLACKHRRTRATEHEASKKTCNVTRKAVSMYLQVCVVCLAKNNGRWERKKSTAAAKNSAETAASKSMETPKEVCQNNTSEEASTPEATPHEESNENVQEYEPETIKVELSSDEEEILSIDYSEDNEAETSNAHDDETKRQELLLQLIKFTNMWKEKEDEFDYFGKSLTTQLKKMPLIDALNMQLEIQNIMNRYRLSLYSEQPCDPLELGPQSGGSRKRTTTVCGYSEDADARQKMFRSSN